MQPSETEKLIRTYLDAFNRSDSEGILAVLGEDVIHDINQGDREIGRGKFRWFNAMMAEHYSEQLGDIAIMVSADGGRAAAEFTVRGTYLKTAKGLPPASGQTYSLPAGIFFEIDDRLISRVTTCYNLQDWIAQVEAASG
ncbi:MAG: cytosolic protein [Hyphomicrobiales bacterium]|nr:cytosolic protein [Hyphomicrobiales bacterium]MCP5001332.1 cytosolic protein [Hyphomicrobiales bacterium]